MKHKIATKGLFTLGALLIGIAGYSATAFASDFKYHKKVNLRVGQSIVVKGVRGKCSGTKAPSFKSLHLPKIRLGKFSDGGAGTVQSKSCKKRVPARGVKFTATKPGFDKFEIYKDSVIINVKP
ncbi:MAG: hypothetical protein JKY99_10990 [Rhizobiales bacterium]|nr:hypothetical protein [Hyphomicrobiales bacterium]